MTKFWCVLCRETRFKIRGPVTSSRSLSSFFRKITLIAVRMVKMVLRVMLTQNSNMVTEEIFVSCGPIAFQEHLQEDNI